MGFEPYIQKLLGMTRKDRQTLMFSATWPRAVRTLAAEFLQPDVVQVKVGASELQASHAQTAGHRTQSGQRRAPHLPWGQSIQRNNFSKPVIFSCPGSPSMNLIAGMVRNHFAVEGAEVGRGGPTSSRFCVLRSGRSMRDGIIYPFFIKEPKGPLRNPRAGRGPNWGLNGVKNQKLKSALKNFCRFGWMGDARNHFFT